MNPARTIGTAVAGQHYKGIWVYLVGPLLGTLMGAWYYNMIRVSDNQVHDISPRLSSFKVRRLLSKNQENQLVNKDPLDNL
ncbi:hypothetical protein MKX01_021715 [Papaver californicum]|nr:hypothetical protein MKX01_021715 [Papaver californicum]